MDGSPTPADLSSDSRAKNPSHARESEAAMLANPETSTSTTTSHSQAPSNNTEKRQGLPPGETVQTLRAGDPDPVDAAAASQSPAEARANTASTNNATSNANKSQSSTTTKKKQGPKRKKSRSSGFGRTTHGRNRKQPVVQAVESRESRESRENSTSRASSSTSDSGQLTLQQLKQRLRNQDRTISSLRLDIDTLKTTNSSLQQQLVTKDTELKAALAKSREEIAAKNTELKAALARAREDKRASNEVIHNTMEDAKQMKEESDDRMKQAEQVKLDAERDAAKRVQAERNYTSTKIARAQQVLERERRGHDAIIAVKDKQLATAKAEVLEQKAIADMNVRELKRKHSEAIVTMKAEERHRKKRQGELLNKKNKKLAEARDKHAAELVEMQTFLNDMAADWKLSLDEAATARKQKTDIGLTLIIAGASSIP